MFNPWFAFSLNAFQMGVEAQSVIALRLLRFASGGARSEAEATRMLGPGLECIERWRVIMVAGNYAHSHGK
jgi:hypothetical protein